MILLDLIGGLVVAVLIVIGGMKLIQVFAKGATPNTRKREKSK